MNIKEAVKILQGCRVSQIDNHPSPLNQDVLNEAYIVGLAALHELVKIFERESYRQQS